MHSKTPVKKRLGTNVLLMGNKILTIYQNTTFTEDTFLARTSLTALQPADKIGKPLWPRTQSPEGERIVIHHTAEIHAEPRQPMLYPTLPATHDFQPTEEEQREPAATVQQENPPEVYEQQPSTNPDLRRQAYSKMGPPVQLRTTKITTRKHTKSAPSATKFNEHPKPPTPPRPPVGPQPTNNSQAGQKPTQKNALASPYSVQPPPNNPTIMGLRYTEVLNNTIAIPRIDQDSVSRNQIARLLVKNRETFERDAAIEACTRR